MKTQAILTVHVDGKQKQPTLFIAILGIVSNKSKSISTFMLMKDKAKQEAGKQRKKRG